MRAAQVIAYGGPDSLRVTDDAPEPQPSADQVQIEVHASSVNPIDCKIRDGAFRAALRYPLPHTLGMDVSGVVRAVGAKVTRWKVGDQVIGSPGPRTPGTYAEVTCMRDREVGRKPTNLSHAEAASLPLAFLTAWQGLHDRARLRAGQKVLITAGSGGVGTLAIQIARHLGAYVATTCSAGNAELVRGLGADQVIDYRTAQYDELLADYDVVFDALGLDEARRARKILRRGGRIVGISVGLPERVKASGPVRGLLGTGVAVLGAMLGSRLRAGVTSRFITRRADGHQLDHLADLCEAGAIRPVIDTVYPLADIVAAHRHSDSGRARGKLVIAVR